MEVAVAEEKKKIFRARKTMKISDRQQLETLHNTLLTGASPLSNPSPPPLVNGMHKDDGQKAADKEQNDVSDTNSVHATSPVSPASRGSPAPSLSLNLSPSPPASQSPSAKEDAPSSPTSPFHCLNFELKKMEEEGKRGSSTSPSNVPPDSAATGAKDSQAKGEVTTETTKTEKKEEAHTTTKNSATTSLKDPVKDSVPCPSVSPAVSGKKSEKDHKTVPDCTEPMETDCDTKEAKAPEASTAKSKVEKPSSPKASASSSHSSSTCSSSSRPAPSASMAPVEDQEIKEEEEEEEEEEDEQGKKKVEGIREERKDDKEEVKKGLTKIEKMDVEVKVETKKEKTEVGQSSKPSRPSSTPPSDTVVQEERSSSSGLKRALSEGEGKDGEKEEREGKRPKVEGVELEAQLELKITAKAGSRLKLEKVVEQLVEERLRVLQLTVFDKSLQELKDRVDKIDCATKHQTTLSTLQAKIARLAKKFGEANQASENKRKQEALAAATAAATAAVAATAAKTATNPPPTQRPVRTSMEVKQTLTTPALTSTTVPAPSAQPTLASTSTAITSQAPILQLITTTSNACSPLATGITTQSAHPQGTLLLKTAAGGGMVAQGQPLLIQLPLTMTNGQTGTLVKFPVTSFSTANSLNKSKTTTPTATFILKPAPAITTTAVSAPTAATVSALQTSAGQMSPAQISLARAVYQGGAGGISTPNAGVSVTTARTPAQLVSVAGAVSSSSSPATSGPAATGSAAPGPPQGTSMTSKTDNQATSSTPTKTAVAATRPKGSVIDLTEDDDDVQVTGVKNAPVTPSASQRPAPVITIPNSTGARSSPQSNPTSASNPQLTVHHRPPLDSPLKPRTVPTSMTTRSSTTALPPLPTAPPPQGRLPPEATQTSPPQQPQLKLVPSQTGIVLSWCVAETDRSCATVDSYHLYAFHQDNSNSANAAQQHWKKIGEVKALPLPMACTLTQFQSGSTYYFAVRAKDIYGRFGSFCEPQCTNVISSASS